MEVHPVVHVDGSSPEAVDKAIRQANVALGMGAAGVYLIDHKTWRHPKNLQEVYKRVWHSVGDESRLGVNFLGLSTSEALDLIGGMGNPPDSLWVDDVRDSGQSSMSEAHEQARSCGIELLGGIAFKYTDLATNNPGRAAKYVRMLGGDSTDVIVTSGLGTGIPPTPEKIKAMKDAAGGQPLAVASGIDERNIGNFRGLVDRILVASSVETYPGSGEFDEEKLGRLLDLSRGY